MSKKYRFGKGEGTLQEDASRHRFLIQSQQPKDPANACEAQAERRESEGGFPLHSRVALAWASVGRFRVC